MRYVVADFETASAADLNKIGAWKYAQDFSTIPLCLSIKVVTDGKPAKSRCIPEGKLHGLDPELMALAKDPSVIFVAHNASFEQAIWKFQMVPMGYPELPPERWHDTLATAAMRGLPLGLDALCKALDLPAEKDMEGHRLMMTMCKPDKNGGWSQHNSYNLERLYRYCNGDVEAQYGVYIVLKGLGPSERAVWIADQKVQQRGVLIDKPFVEACMDVLEQVRVPMTERFVALTGVKPTQRAKILEWINANGIPLNDTKKETLDAVLDPNDEFTIDDVPVHIPANVLEAIDLRRSLSSSSVSKLQRMVDCMPYDGRIRYTTQYHVARTGRDGGRLIQIQNFPRGSIGDHEGVTAETLADAILTRDAREVQKLWGPNVYSAVVSSLRSCIVPSPGKVIVAGDFAAVEARNLLSMAGQHDRVDQMHNGLDVYSETASMIYGRPINRKNPAQAKEGQIGKNTVLGCLSALTRVLTDRGWKAIVDVTEEDRLWDGEEWVTHSGLSYRGFKETLNISGLHLTTDHAVFDGAQWFRADEATAQRISLALAYSKANGLSSATATLNTGTSMGLYVGALAEMVRSSWINTTSRVVDLLAATNVRSRKAYLPPRNIGVTRTYAVIAVTEPDFSTGSQPFKLGALQVGQTVSITMPEASAYTLNGWVREAVGVMIKALKRAVSSFPSFSRLKGGTTRASKSTASTTTETMSREILDLLRALPTAVISAVLRTSNLHWTPREQKWKRFEHVYDLVNAGPRSRFTVMTSRGPMVVHNSGYGLGYNGFQNRFAPKEPFELAKRAIDAYRNEFAPKVPKFWYGLFDASVKAVWCTHGKAYSYEGVEFRREPNDFLSMRLPSGRKLWYHRPRRATTQTPSGDEKPAWTFLSYQGKKCRRHLAWHGLVTADCIQGSARDLMTEAMLRAESAGLTTIFKVHDELVFEEDDRSDICDVVKQVMEDISPWARERKFRVKAEVEKMHRYRK